MHLVSLVHPPVQSNPRPSMKCVSIQLRPPPFSRVFLYPWIIITYKYSFLYSLHGRWRDLAHKSMGQEANGPHHEAEHNGRGRYDIPLQCIKIHPSSLEQIQEKQMHPGDGCDPGIFQQICHGREAPAGRTSHALLLKRSPNQIDHPVVSQ